VTTESEGEPMSISAVTTGLVKSTPPVSLNMTKPVVPKEENPRGAEPNELSALEMQFKSLHAILRG
jgi:hypothetical protein